ncbi:unnamed protein product [Prorocentrum cordatum]|uniref:Uncharacterized protein n=1 Tax=Prorocentrum cordatum TaxID=2364126 RepID=A0ABN9T9B9_9DINO|nr:unnamed protein product [Polarella glacialis]
MPMECRLGKLLVYASILGCLESGLTVAGQLSLGRNPFLNLKTLASTAVGAAGTAEIQRKRDTLIVDGGQVARASSDPLLVCAALEQWKCVKGNWRRRRLYCQELGLSDATLSEIDSLRETYRRHLMSSGLVHVIEPGLTSSPSRPASTCTNASESSCDAERTLLKCCLVSALYPNLAQIQRSTISTGGVSRGGRAGRGGRGGKVVTSYVLLDEKVGLGRAAFAPPGRAHGVGRAAAAPAAAAGGPRPGCAWVHPSSCNAASSKENGSACNATAHEPWLLYFKKMMTSSLYLFDTTLVDCTTVLLFGGFGGGAGLRPSRCTEFESSLRSSVRLKRSRKRTNETSTSALLSCRLTLDGVFFDCDEPETVVLVRCLREEVDRLLVDRLDNTQVQQDSGIVFSLVRRAVLRLLGAVDEEHELDEETNEDNVG